MEQRRCAAIVGRLFWTVLLNQAEGVYRGSLQPEHIWKMRGPCFTRDPLRTEYPRR